VDYNRAGMPLLEIVTDPDIDHPEDGKLAVKELQDLLKALGISNANMEEGEMRCDVNVSLSNDKVQGNRVEVKNVLGIRFVEKAIEYEIIRHAELLTNG
jgi:aspartyl-tRNA(Asn)/glutamyl-tRNA(Gln) amidotransferase subunit B